MIDVAANEWSLLEGIPIEKRAAVLRCLNARAVHFEKGDILAGYSCALSCTRYLVEGEALVVRYDMAGNRSILDSYHDNTVIASELTPRFYSSNRLDVVASKPCTVIDFSISQEIESCACCIKYINLIKGNLMISLTEMNTQLMARLDTLANRSTREKVLAYLQECSKGAGSMTFTISYNRQELADYLYIERSALSRELSRMQREGIISFDRNRFALTQKSFPEQVW